MRLLLLLFAMSTCGTAMAHGISAADRQRMIEGGYYQYIELGAGHMLTGYDHLLFLFGVVFFLTTFKDIVKFITAFTLGHSITLIIATFFKISANYYLIDAVIALSVCYKGFDNIDGFKKYLEIDVPDLLKAVFSFGLIHGFGLSTRLQQLPMGDDNVGIFLRIISFNLGVEVGQIAALSVMLLVLASWRKSESFRKFSFIANSAVIFVGIILFYMQLHGFVHQVAVDDFAFSEDSHDHAHQKMKERNALNLLKIKTDNK
ncbi:MAG: HupE/UreJ family protein [Bdellovibrionota bacterium]